MTFKKGQSGNPKGKPKGATTYSADLKRILNKVEKKQGKELLEHACEEAFTDNKVLIALIKKIVPDLKQVDLKGDVEHKHDINFINKRIRELTKELSKFDDE